ncbi:MAG TPA: NF038122 family metalloprotease [Pyrinomonadaceae bacterium]
MCTRAHGAALRLARRAQRLLPTALALLLATAAPAALAARAQTGDTPAPAASPSKEPRAGSSFVIYRDASGETVCRPADEAEMRGLLRSREARGGRLIYAGAPRQLSPTGEVIPSPLAAAGQADAPGLALAPSAGLHIFLHGTPQLEAYPEAKNAFIAAANRWEALVSTPVNVVLDVDFGPEFFGSEYPDPDILGATGTAEVVERLSDVRQRLLNNSPTAAEQALYNALPTGALTTEFGGSNFNSTTVRLGVPNARALGLEADVADPNAAEGDAGIGFNSEFNEGQGGFDFNPNDGIETGLTDFDSVVTHEIGHALGFTSEAGGPVYAAVSMWDVFRFRPGAASVANFGSAPRVMSAGGQQVYFNGQNNTFGTQELLLSTGGPGGTSPGGDGRQSSHWRDDSLTGVYIGVMDPTLGPSRRRTITDNDVKALDSLGWSIGAAVPHPAPPPAPPSGPPVNDNFQSAVILTGANGTVNGDSTGATKQSGEPTNPASAVGGRSVWYFWTAPASGTATFDTEGSAFDTILAVYTGSFGGLTLVGSNDDIGGGFVNSKVTFTASAGTTYRIAVDGFRNNASIGAEFGVIQLNWSGSTAAPPATTVQFATTNFSVFERDRAAGVLVTRTGADQGDCAVSFTAQGSPAVVGGGTFQRLVFGPGEKYKVVTLDINDDTTAEPDAAVTLTLSDPAGTGVALGTPASATLTVADDDTFPANTAQFTGAALRNVAEGAGKVELTVTRAGDLSQAAAVNYRTNNGSAVDTRDYTFARGVLRFAPGEASRTLTVLVADDAYDEADETFNVELLAPVGTSVGADSIVTIQVLDDDAQTGASPLADSAFFVRQHYADFFNREPDAPGLAFWTGNIESCGSDAGCREAMRVNVSGAFFLSIEFQETGYLVYRTYKVAFGDVTNTVPGPPPGGTEQIFVPVVKLDEFLPDTFSIGQGVQVNVGDWRQQLELNKQAFFAEFVTRGRFKAAVPAELTPAQAVDLMNARAGGVLTPAERDSLVAQLAANNTTAGRASVLRQIVENPKLGSNELNRAFVLMQYFGYLRRNPSDLPDTDFRGWRFWLTKLNQFGGDFVAAEMVKAFIASDEYRNRFGQ